MPPKQNLFQVKVIPSENRPKDKRMEQMNYNELPALPVIMMMIGSAGAGKSSILYSLLKEGFTYGEKKKSIFDEASIFLGTMDSIETFEKLPIKNLVVLTDFVPEPFNEYMEDLQKHQMERLDKNKHMLNAVLAFDDMVGKALMKHHEGESSPLERLCVTSRHYNCSLIFCSQVYKNTGFSNPTVRNQVGIWVISKVSLVELRKIADEHCNALTPKQFMAVYMDIMKKKPYNFLVVDYRKPFSDRITEQFSTPIVVPHEDDIDEKETLAASKPKAQKKLTAPAAGEKAVAKE